MQLLAMIIALALAPISCQKQNATTAPSTREHDEMRETKDPSQEPESDLYAAQREKMVDDQIVRRGIEDERVIDAMRKVPRHEFVPEEWRYRAYADGPAPIGHDQTISQPYIVAIMTELLDVKKGDKVLEIGTGSGYQAAVLAEIGVELYSIEIVCPLAERAEETLDGLGYDEVNVKCGDGYKGWPSEAPFDRVIVTAAPPEIPPALVEQLEPGGRMVVPVGDRFQELKVIEKKADGTTDVQNVFDVRFVPMVHGEDAGSE